MLSASNLPVIDAHAIAKRDLGIAHWLNKPSRNLSSGLKAKVR
jgi:hypothetical protein